jgi:hypothetical protein
MGYVAMWLGTSLPAFWKNISSSECPKDGFNIILQNVATYPLKYKALFLRRW